MPYSPEAYAYTPVNYVGESGSIPALLLYERDGLSYLRFRTKSWPHYDGWGLWRTVGIFSEHVVTADPHEPAVADLLQELERDTAAQQQHLSNCRHQANGQRVSNREISKQENGQGSPAPKTCAKVPQGDGVKPPLKPAKPPATQRKARASGEAVHSLKPVRSIAGLTLADFLYDR
jgi:hypothetical protein